MFQFEAMFDELADYFKEIWQAGHTGVLLALAKTCKRLSAKQGSYLVVSLVFKLPISHNLVHLNF